VSRDPIDASAEQTFGEASAQVAEPGTVRPPLERVLDLVWYAPVGAVLTLRDHLPKHAAQRRQAIHNRVQLSHFIGRLAVDQGRQELARRTAQRRDQRAQSEEPAAAGADPAAPVAASVPDTTHERSGTHLDASTLPIDGYESLAAIHIVDRLGGLDDAELDAIEEFELAHRARRTVLAKIDQVRSR
jgi:hypothetical protein